jgi:ankyrin repeat protein
MSRPSTSTWHDAAKRGDFVELRRLLRVDKSLVSARDQQGRTVLHCLANLELRSPEDERQAGDMLTTLLTYPELDLDAANDAGHVPLHRACQSASRFALCLVAAGANLEARTARERRTPLELCRNSGLRELLIDAYTAVSKKKAAPVAAEAVPSARVSHTTAAHAPAAEPAGLERRASVCVEPKQEQAVAEAGGAVNAVAGARDAPANAPLPDAQQPPPAEGGSGDGQRRKLEQTPLDEAACAAWDRIASGLPSLDFGETSALVWRHGVPPALRHRLWCASVGATPEVWTTLANTHGVSLTSLAMGATPADGQAIDEAVADLDMRLLLRATACAAGAFHSRSVPLGTLAMFVCAGDEHSAFLLLLAMLRITRRAAIDADAVALHISRRRPDVVAALGPGGGGHTLDFLTSVSKTWGVSPAREALVAGLCPILERGFVKTARLESLLRLWDVALLSNTQHPQELLASVAAVGIAWVSDAIARAGKVEGREAAIVQLSALRFTGDPDELLKEVRASMASGWAQCDGTACAKLEELAGSSPAGTMTRAPSTTQTALAEQVAATHAQSLACAASEALDAALLSRWATVPPATVAFAALRVEAVKWGRWQEDDPARFAQIPPALFDEIARSKDKALQEYDEWADSVALKEPPSYFNTLWAAHQGDYGNGLDTNADKVRALVAVLDDTLIW